MSEAASTLSTAAPSARAPKSVFPDEIRVLSDGLASLLSEVARLNDIAELAESDPKAARLRLWAGPAPRAGMEALWLAVAAAAGVGTGEALS